MQPSANPKEWKKLPRKGAEVTQEEEWLSSGIGKLIQERESIIYALNPMGVSSVFNHRDEGSSSAWVNMNLAVRHAAGKQDDLSTYYGKYRGLFRIAESCNREEIVYGRF